MELQEKLHNLDKADNMLREAINLLKEIAFADGRRGRRYYETVIAALEIARGSSDRISLSEDLDDWIEEVVTEQAKGGIG